ncbi:RNA polymerase sigma-70 factor [Ancylomarina sp. 16SWW S1-10-2]|uniref:RNA polymerase sigma factor n=1 Tax=Ancylomarina sp. 16SWW S1-10-2 TaxID=2499681 RepID=UPI0012AE28B6|nr:RNA polymerase sigma-70 factor [Ancylomarina sp. 16SWW S1-10-2]
MSNPQIDIRKIDFKAVFESYFPSLCVFATRFVHDEDLSKDLVQDVFVRIWNSKTKFESEKSMRVYFYIATKNICFDYLKKEKNRKISLDVDPNTQELADDDFYVNEVIREETYRMLSHFIEQLPEKARDVMRLNLKGLSNSEICDELDVSINTVKTHKRLAFNRLREMFGKEYAIFILVEFYEFLS